MPGHGSVPARSKPPDEGSRLVDCVTGSLSVTCPTQDVSRRRRMPARTVHDPSPDPSHHRHALRGRRSRARQRGRRWRQPLLGLRHRRRYRSRRKEHRRPEGSDAAWLARLAKTFFEQEVTPGRAMADIVRTLNKQAAHGGSRCRRRPADCAWSLPVAGFQLVRVEGESLVTYGLGDCRLFLTGADGVTVDTTALQGSHAREREGARRAIAHAGGLAAVRVLADDPTVRDELRRHRATLQPRRLVRLDARHRARRGKASCRRAADRRRCRPPGFCARRLCRAV